jgi:hypothetical protein
MNKKAKITIIGALTAVLLVYWVGLAITHAQYELINYVWQAGLSVNAILFGLFGMLAAKRWSWLKSGVGQGVFFISLGLLMWGLGQAGWTYAVIKDPNYQTPPSRIIDIMYSCSIPLWTYGMLRLSKATGAKYGLKSLGAKLGVAGLIAVMLALSYYFLVVVARGGVSYFHSDTFWTIFYDLWYAAGDAINLTLALAIFGLSWKYLGGMFKKPILLILLGFAMIYISDFLFSFYDGKGQYYNGHWTDLPYLAMVAIFGAGLCLLDPIHEATAPATATPVAPTSPITTVPTASQIIETAVAPPHEAVPEAAVDVQITDQQGGA